MQILFNKPFMTGREIDYIAKAHGIGKLAGDGEFFFGGGKMLHGSDFKFLASPHSTGMC